MARTKTTKSVETAAPVVVESVVAAPVAASAPVVKKSAKKPTPVVAAAPAASSAAVDEVVVECAEGEAPIAEQSVEFLAKLQQLGVLISSLKAEYRTLEKKWTREVKTAQKQSSKRKRKAGNRAPSGFVKPTKISAELADFLSKPHGTLMARTDVTKQMTSYIRANSLQDKANGRIILPDTKLRKLLKLTDKDSLTYFNLQKYMSPHFEKTVV